MADEPEDVIEPRVSTLRERLEATHDDRVDAHTALKQKGHDRRVAKRESLAAGDNPVPEDKRSL